MTVNQSIQAIVLCGRGTRLGVLTSDEAALPKALLPCGDAPLVQRTLDWLLSDGSVKGIYQKLLQFE
jgi:NDP-sugar pyrophosphorylase family protein